MNATDPSGLFIKKWAKAVWNHSGGLVYDLVANASQAHATNEQAAAVGAGHEEYTGLRDAVQAGVRGLDIGLRGTVNGLVTAARSTVTLGIVDSPWQLMSVDHLSPEDRALYNQSFAFANAGGELLLGLAPGALASRCGRMARVASAANAFDAAGNVVSVVRGVAEGDPLRAVMGLVGLGGNAATARHLRNVPCFTGRMLIRCEQGKKRADAIRENDLLWARDENNPVAPLELKRVEEVFVRVAPIVNLHVAGQILETTAEHPFYVLNRQMWVPTAMLQVGDQLLTDQGMKAVRRQLLLPVSDN